MCPLCTDICVKALPRRVDVAVSKISFVEDNRLLKHSCSPHVTVLECNLYDYYVVLLIFALQRLSFHDELITSKPSCAQMCFERS
jgi:hypothetical protein